MTINIAANLNPKSPKLNPAYAIFEVAGSKKIPLMGFATRN